MELNKKIYNTNFDENLEEIIQIEKEVGERAEQLTLSYEKGRLNERNYQDMAMSIQQISKILTNF